MSWRRLVRWVFKREPSRWEPPPPWWIPSTPKRVAWDATTPSRVGTFQVSAKINKRDFLLDTNCIWILKPTTTSYRRIWKISSINLLYQPQILVDINLLYQPRILLDNKICLWLFIGPIQWMLIILLAVIIVLLIENFQSLLQVNTFLRSCSFFVSSGPQILRSFVSLFLGFLSPHNSKYSRKHSTAPPKSCFVLCPVQNGWKGLNFMSTS